MDSSPRERADGGSVDLWFASRTIVAKGGLLGRIHHGSTGAETLYERRMSLPTSSLEPNL
jgi:hypothetical protein